MAVIAIEKMDDKRGEGDDCNGNQERDGNEGERRLLRWWLKVDDS